MQLFLIFLLARSRRFAGAGAGSAGQAAIDLGALSNLAGEIGEQLLAKAAEPPEEALPMNEPPPHRSVNGKDVLTEEEDKQVAFYLQQGYEAVMRGDFREAITACDEILNIKPDDHQALYNKGASLSNLGRHEEAIAAYDQALHFKPDKHEALISKGVAFKNLQRYRDVITVFSDIFQK